jgi:hypothetical protein
MATPKSIELQLYEHVFGEREPTVALLNTGMLSDEWTDTYLRLLKETAQTFEGQPSLPREIVAAVHFASWYLNIRYDAWRGFNNGERNQKTEHNLGRLRTPSELLLLSAYAERERAKRSG